MEETVELIIINTCCLRKVCHGAKAIRLYAEKQGFSEYKLPLALPSIALGKWFYYYYYHFPSLFIFSIFRTE